MAAKNTAQENLSLVWKNRKDDSSGNRKGDSSGNRKGDSSGLRKEIGD